MPGVKNFGSHIGRAEVADEVVGPNFTELWISIDPKADHATTLGQVQAVGRRLPGPLQGRADLFEGADQGGLDRCRGHDGGPDLRAGHERAPRQGAGSRTRRWSAIPGITNLKVEPQLLVPQLDVRLRPEASARLGLTAGDIRRAATTLVKGSKVGELYREQKIFDVFVWGTEEVRNDVSKLSALPVETPLGTHVPLSDVAEIALVPAANEIKREGASRRIDVTCNIAPGADLGSVAKAVEEKVKALEFPREYHPEFLGEYAARAESQNRLMALAGPVAPGHPADHPRRLPLAPADGAGGPDAAVRPDRRGGRRDPRRRRAVARLAGRLRHRAGHRGAERDHAGQPLSPPRAGGGRSRSGWSWCSAGRRSGWRRS